jgi:hypothetical protein
MMSEAEHPVELLHRGRDAIQAAAAAQGRNPKPSPDDLHATGSAMVAVLSALWQLSDVLSHEADELDEDIEQQTVTDHPVDDLRSAVGHLMHLRGLLSVAYADAEQYWHAVERVHRKTSPRDGESD